MDERQKRMKQSLRDHGLSECRPIGVPKAKKLGSGSNPTPSDAVKCPNCGCVEIMQIEVQISNSMLRGNGGMGYYLGCPACPWASKMMAVSMTPRSTPLEE